MVDSGVGRPVVKMLRNIWSCFCGRHKWIGLQSPDRYAFVCERCLKFKGSYEGRWIGAINQHSPWGDEW